MTKISEVMGKTMERKMLSARSTLVYRNSWDPKREFSGTRASLETKSFSTFLVESHKLAFEHGMIMDGEVNVELITAVEKGKERVFIFHIFSTVEENIQIVQISFSVRGEEKEDDLYNLIMGREYEDDQARASWVLEVMGKVVVGADSFGMLLDTVKRINDRVVTRVFSFLVVKDVKVHRFKNDGIKQNPEVLRWLLILKPNDTSTLTNILGIIEFMDDSEFEGMKKHIGPFFVHVLGKDNMKAEAMHTLYNIGGNGLLGHIPEKHMERLLEVIEETKGKKDRELFAGEWKAQTKGLEGSNES